MKRLIVLAVIVGLAAAIRYLPWWGSTALIIATPILGWMLFKRFVTQFFLGAFKAKSEVLKGASARILSIEPAPPFKPEDEEEVEDLFEDLEQPHHWVYIDVQVDVPDNPDTPMNYWEPDDLAVVSEEAKGGDLGEDDDVGHVFAVEVMDGSAWVMLDGKVAGSQRLRLHVAAREGVDRFRLRYYFEILKNAG